MNVPNSKDELYKAYLYEINGIKFTVREIDIISCIVHNRGNKKIAGLLSIAYRTVDAHIYNITSKINKNSKDDIIDFTEKSGKIPYIRQYYCCILIEDLFSKTLLNISKTINKTLITYTINATNFLDISKESTLIINQKLQKLQNDLKLANIILSIDTPGVVQYHLLKSDNNTYNNTKKEIILLFDDVTSPPQKEVEYIDFTTNQNYHLSVFALLEKIINNPAYQTIESEFKAAYKILLIPLNGIDIKDNHNSDNNLSFKKFDKSKITALAFILILFLTFFIYIFYNKSLGTEKNIAEINQIFAEFAKTFSGENMVDGAIYDNYPTIKITEEKIVDLNKKNISDYFSSPKLPHDELMNCLHSLCELAIYYMYSNHHDWEKAQQSLLLAKTFAENQIINRGGTINFSENSAEIIYTEFVIIKDLPEIYTRILYYLGRTYISQGKYQEALKYFETTKYLGEKLGLFEGFSSTRSGIAIIKSKEIDLDIKNNKLQQAKEKLKELIKLYKVLINNGIKYKLAYKPKQAKPVIIVPKDDEYNQVVCIHHILKCYTKLILIADILQEKHQYGNEILQELINSKENHGFLVSLNKIDQKSYRFASVLNTLANILLKLYDSKIDIDQLKIYLANELQLAKNDDLSFILQLFELASSKSRNTEYTKVDAYDGIIGVYQRQIMNSTQLKVKQKLINELKLLKDKRDAVNKNIKRTFE